MTAGCPGIRESISQRNPNANNGDPSHSQRIPNEYADLIGGEFFEPDEANPMLGFRGASRYYSDDYRPGFRLECRAMRRVRAEIGLNNVVVMIPFCRTVDEAERVIDVLAEVESN